MSSSMQDLIPLLDLGDTFGALFIAVILAAVLFGLSNVQAFIYFQTHRDTGITDIFKLVVIWLCLLDALHLALIVHCVYYYLVTNYANISALTKIVWSFKLQIVIDVFIVYGVHLLYVYRIWIVSKGRSRVLPVTVGIIVFLVSAVAISLVWAVYQCHVFSDLNGIAWATYLTLGTTTFVDMLIALSLCYLLATSRTGFPSTDSLLIKLLGYTINTGCLTSICSLVAIITCATMPKNFIFLGVEFLVAKLYINSFLALMNARYYIQANTDTVDSSDFHTLPGAHRTEAHMKASQDEKLQASRKIVFKRPDSDVLPTPPVRAVMRPIAVTVDVDSFSSV